MRAIYRVIYHVNNYRRHGIWRFSCPNAEKSSKKKKRFWLPFDILFRFVVWRHNQFTVWPIIRDSSSPPLANIYTSETGFGELLFSCVPRSGADERKISAHRWRKLVNGRSENGWPQAPAVLLIDCDYRFAIVFVHVMAGQMWGPKNVERHLATRRRFGVDKAPH